MNSRQRMFARLVASGATQVDAYAEAYKPARQTRKSQHERASVIAAHPDVRQAIAEFEARTVPIDDLRSARQRMLANIQQLALFSPDERVRLAASIDLRNYADQREERERALPAKSSVNVEQLLSELAELRARQAPATLELEAVADTGEPVAAEAAALGEVEEEL